MTNLTLHMIVKNEEKHLPNCLKSIRDWVDEIIIVDTGSTDNTIAWAIDMGANVKTFDWVDDFSAARNYALCHVRTPWTLWLDADDIVLNPETIQPAIDEAYKLGANAIWSTYKQDEGSLQRRLQLFRTKQFKWEGYVHESPIRKPRYKPGDYLSDLVVLHRKPLERRPEAARKYLDILLAKDPTNWLGIAESYKYLSIHPDDPSQLKHYQEQADAYYWRTWEDPNVNDQCKYLALFCSARVNLDRALHDAKWYKMAHRTAQLGVGFAPFRAECWVIVGQCWEVQGVYHKAIEAYETALNSCEIPDDDIGLYYTEYYDTLPRLLLEGVRKKVKRDCPEESPIIVARRKEQGIVVPTIEDYK